jgi:hypothetical protein
MEECGETVQAASKVLKRGRHGVEKYSLSEECGDVLACIELLEERGLLDLQSMNIKPIVSTITSLTLEVIYSR